MVCLLCARCWGNDIEQKHTLSWLSKSLESGILLRISNPKELEGTDLKRALLWKSKRSSTNILTKHKSQADHKLKTTSQFSLPLPTFSTLSVFPKAKDDWVWRFRPLEFSCKIYIPVYGIIFGIICHPLTSSSPMPQSSSFTVCVLALMARTLT